MLHRRLGVESSQRVALNAHFETTIRIRVGGPASNRRQASCPQRSDGPLQELATGIDQPGKTRHGAELLSFDVRTTVRSQDRSANRISIPRFDARAAVAFSIVVSLSEFRGLQRFCLNGNLDRLRRRPDFWRKIGTPRKIGTENAATLPMNGLLDG
jgi:hypothetical protein